MNVTSLVVLRKVERFWLDVVRLTSTHSMPSQALEGLDSILVSHWLAACILEFSLVDKRVVFQRLRAQKQVLTIICFYVPNNSSEYPAILELLGGMLEGAPSGGSVVLLGDFNGQQQ